MSARNKPVVATVQARMGSSRLPGKTLKDIVGKPALELLLERLSGAREVDDIVVATSTERADDPVEALCNRLGYSCFRGSVDDVLGRCVAAAESAGASLVALITGDCILTCPEVVDLAVRTFHSTGCDYLSNLMVQTYPQGVDARVFRFDDWHEIDRKLAGDDPIVREHVYLYFEEHPERYILYNMCAPAHHKRPEWRLDLDYEEDLRLLRIVFGDLYGTDPQFDLDTLVGYLDLHPELMKINQGMARKQYRA